MDNEKDFTDILRGHLKGQNLSAVARRVDIPRSLLFDWVNGRRMPSYKQSQALARLATYLGISFEELVLGSKKNKNDKVISSVSFSDDAREYAISIRRIK